MAKKRNRRAKRDANAVANPLTPPSLTTLLSPLSPLKPIRHVTPKRLTLIEDRRSWHPQGASAPAKSVHKSRHRLALKPGASVQGVRSTPARTAPMPAGIHFQAPKKVLICIRRKMRKQVLFALRKTGKGAKARKHRRSFYSSVRC